MATSRITSLSEALALPSSTDVSDVVAVVVEISMEKVKRRGNLSVVDTSIGNSCAVVISVHGPTLMESLSSISTGDLILLRGLATARPSDRTHFRLSSYEFTSSASIKMLSGTSLKELSCHANASALTALSHKVSNTSLGQRVCRRRCLTDIQFPGQLSTVEVKVISHELVSTTKTFRKRKWSRREDDAFAMLIQDSTRIVLVDCRKHTRHLKSAQVSKDPVQITNLISCKVESGEIVLRPTNLTLFLPAKGRGSGTRAASHNVLNQPRFEQSPRKSQIIFSCLKTIFIDELNQELSMKHFSDSSTLAHTIARSTPFPCYREATLTLEAGTLAVKASADIVQVLCASIDAKVFLAEERTRTAVLDLVWGLLVEGTQLKWTIDGCIVKKLEIARL